MLRNQWAPWDGWFCSEELTGVVMLCKWVPQGRGVAAQCLREMHVQCNTQLESSRLARSILWKQVKPLVPLAVFSKIQLEVFRQADGLWGPKFLETWGEGGSSATDIHDSEANRKNVLVLSWWKCLCSSCFGGQALPSEVRLVYIQWSRQGLQHRTPPWRFLLPKEEGVK